MDTTFEGTIIIERELTAEEIHERQEWAREESDRIALEQARVTALESARAKFRAFKLTEEEINAVFSQATLS